MKRNYSDVSIRCWLSFFLAFRVQKKFLSVFFVVMSSFMVKGIGIKNVLRKLYFVKSARKLFQMPLKFFRKKIMIFSKLQMLFFNFFLIRILFIIFLNKTNIENIYNAFEVLKTYFLYISFIFKVITYFKYWHYLNTFSYTIKFE